MYKQAVVRLCQGAADKEAGSYASNIRPKNIEEAIDRMRWFQHSSQAIYGTTLGRNPRREVKQVSGKSLNALVARDKTRSAQSSRRSSGV
jgi:hypothetical protein